MSETQPVNTVDGKVALLQGHSSQARKASMTIRAGTNCTDGIHAIRSKTLIVASCFEYCFPELYVLFAVAGLQLADPGRPTRM